MFLPKIFQIPQMFLPKIFQIPQMFLPKMFQIPQMFLPKIFQIPQMVKTEEIYTDTSFSGKPNERFWHENALFLEKKWEKVRFRAILRKV